MDTSLTYARLLLLLVLLCLLLSWGWYQWRYRYILRAARRLPTGIPALPIIGHAYVIYRGAKCMAIHGILAGRRMMHKIGTFSLWLGPFPIFVIRKAEDVHTVLSRTEKSGEYRLFKYALGNGLLTAQADIHKITRRHVNPLFHPHNLAQHVARINSTSRHLVQDLSEHVGRGDFDMSAPVNSLAITSVAYLIFGPEMKIDLKSDEFRNLNRIGNGIARTTMHRVVKMWLWSDTLFNYLWRREVRHIHESWRRFAERYLKTFDHKENKSLDSLEYDGSTAKSKDKAATTLQDAYRVLQKHYPQFNDEDLHFEMMTLLMAGTDTTKIAICSLLLSLAALPSIQDKLFQEIVSVVGAEDRDVAAKDLQEMPYLDQVYKETLRKYNLLPLLFRRTVEDTRLSDCVIPAGATVGVSLLGLHFDPEVFPDPKTFDPDRFGPGSAANIKRHSFLPFGGGPRVCIGAQFAGMVVKMAVIHVLRRFTLTTSVDIIQLKFKVGLALISDSGYHIQLHPRNVNI